MKVEVTKNGLTMAKHNGLVVHVGHDDGQVIQEAINYIELYQSKWYRRIKRWFLGLFKKWGGVSLASGIYDINDTINLGSQLVMSGDNTHIRGRGWGTFLRCSETSMRDQDEG